MTIKEAFDLVQSRVGCGDNSCRFKRPTGMATNGGCTCFTRPGVPSAFVALYKAVEADEPCPEVTPRGAGCKFKRGHSGRHDAGEEVWSTAPAPVSDKGCELDTDGDGNCPIHPDGCPKPQPPADAALSEVANLTTLAASIWTSANSKGCDHVDTHALLAAFAERVRAEVIEECAKMAIEMEARLRKVAPTQAGLPGGPAWVAHDIATQIRATLTRAGSGK